jgi:septin family protein
VRLKLTVVDTPGFGDFVNNDERSAFMFSPIVKIKLTEQLEAHCRQHRCSI